MIGKKLRITIAAGVIAVALYVIVATVSLSGRQQHTLPTTVAPDEEFEDDFDDGSRGLNKHKWDNNCLKTIEQLCNFPVFPKAPDTREESNDFDVTIPQDNGGLRLLGYLRPNSTGKYKLAVASNGVAEVWLSRTKNWRDGQLVAYVSSHDLKQPAQPIKKGNFMASTSQISNDIQLKVRRKYYIEVIVAPGQQWLRENVFVQVAWRRPENTSLEVIDGKFVSPYINDSHKALRKIFDEDLPGALSCAELNRRYVNRYMTAQVVPHLEAKAVENTLPYCEYKPSYLVEPARFKGFSQYSGVYRYARKTFSFPYTNVDGITRNEAAGQAFMAENPLQEQEAKTVVKRYLEALENAYPGKYKLESIAHVEKKEDPEKGSRYLLELNVKDLASGTSYILSEYVYQLRGNNTSLCYPTGMQWNRTADVYLILTSKNLGRWVHHFIKNVEQIVRETNDEHLHVVIFDFDSSDIDLGQVLKNSALSNYRYITQPGSYSRTVSFTEAIKSITDPNAIIVTVDLHLDIGSRLINDIRKHCLKGKTVYAPQIVFLTCGASSARPRGTWYHYSYGTIALYKEDWEKFGGFSPVFAKKVTWGGEDWDIIDGAVKGGLEIERKRGPWVYHYFHDKRGMWQNAPRTASGKS